MCSLGGIFFSKPRWEPKVRLSSLWSLTSQKVRPSCLHLLLFYYIQPPNWHLKPNLDELQDAWMGEGERERDGFGVQFPMPELKLFLSLSFSPSGQMEKIKRFTLSESKHGVTEAVPTAADYSLALWRIYFMRGWSKGDIFACVFKKKVTCLVYLQLEILLDPLAINVSFYESSVC